GRGGRADGPAAVARRGVLLAAPSEDVAERHQRHDLLADLDGGPALDPVDLPASDLDDLVDVIQGDRIDLVVDPHQQAGHDRQRQGEADDEGGPLTGHAPDVDGPAEVLDPALDDVHADAAAGDLGDGLGGAQARVPDVADQLAVGQLAGLGGIDQPLGDDLAADALTVDTPAVIADGDHHAVAAVRGQERHRAGAGLPARLAIIGRLQAVVDRVADHVDQRVGELVDHPLVQLGLL